jgi:hypothetical protein
MIESIKSYAIYGLVFFCTVMFAGCCLQKTYYEHLIKERDQKISSLTSSLDIQNESISMLNKSFLSKNEQILKAQERIKKLVNIDQKRIYQLSNSNVPNDCLQAIQWGINQSKLVDSYESQ